MDRGFLLFLQRVGNVMMMIFFIITTVHLYSVSPNGYTTWGLFWMSLIACYECVKNIIAKE